MQTISVLLNNINNSFGLGGDVFILDFQAPQCTHSKRWQKNESECVGIKHLNSLLPGHYTDCHILHLPLPHYAFADLTSFTLAHYALVFVLLNRIQYSDKAKLTHRLEYFSDIKIRFFFFNLKIKLNLHLTSQHCLNWKQVFSYTITIIDMQLF